MTSTAKKFNDFFDLIVLRLYINTNAQFFICRYMLPKMIARVTYICTCIRRHWYREYAVQLVIIIK